MNKIPNELMLKLKELGFNGSNIEDALMYCEIKINEYWVDCPISERDGITKEYAKKCNEFKKIKKEIKNLTK